MMDGSHDLHRIYSISIWVELNVGKSMGSILTNNAVRSAPKIVKRANTTNNIVSAHIVDWKLIIPTP